MDYFDRNAEGNYSFTSEFSTVLHCFIPERVGEEEQESFETSTENRRESE